MSNKIIEVHCCKAAPYYGNLEMVVVHPSNTIEDVLHSGEYFPIIGHPWQEGEKHLVLKGTLSDYLRYFDRAKAVAVSKEIRARYCEGVYQNIRKYQQARETEEAFFTPWWCPMNVQMVEQIGPGEGKVAYVFYDKETRYPKYAFQYVRLCVDGISGGSSFYVSFDKGHKTYGCISSVVKEHLGINSVLFTFGWPDSIWKEMIERE